MNPIIIIDGDDKNNDLIGGPEAEVLNGKGGDDFLIGGDGNDTLDGGAGKDFMGGQYGNNTYRWGRGAGQDVISHPEGGNAGMNVLQLDESVLAADLRLSRDNQALVVRIAGTDDSVTIDRFFGNENWYTERMTWAYAISEIRFADGALWDIDAIQTKVAMEFKEKLVLDDLDNYMVGPFIDGAGGNDSLYGGGSQSVLSGGSGNDTLIGSDGPDLLLGGSGDDSLVGGYGNDTLEGGAGNDELKGNSGFDTYRFAHGSGNDSIAAPNSGEEQMTIDIGPGVQASTLRLLRSDPSSPDLVLELPLSGERLTIKEYFSAQRKVAIHFADGSVMDRAQVDLKAHGGGMPVNTMDGSDGADALYGSYSPDVLRGGGGDDVLNGYGGDDLLAGGEGNDTLDGLEGNDVVDGGAGDDRILVGNGSATVLFGRASGHDELLPAYGGGTTTVLLEAGITAADITLARSNDNQGPDLLIGVGGAAAGIRVATYFMPLPIDQPLALALQFADGTRWDKQLIDQLLLTGNDQSNVIVGTSGNDRMDGRGGDDWLEGKQGNDRLLGGAGFDVLIGGEGDDTLNGGQGDDRLDDNFGNNTYVFARGDGHDFIFNNTRMPEQRYQSIVFADGIRPEDVQLRRIAGSTSDDLVLRILGAPDQQITLQGFVYHDADYATNMQLKEIRFADGSKWDMAAIVQRLTTGTDGNDAITGTGYDDVIDAKDGNDLLIGQDGNDTLIGGRGDDQLEGGAGIDTYVINMSDGRDRLTDVRAEGAPGNVIRFGEGIAPYNVGVRDSGGELQLTYGQFDDAITLANSRAGLPAAQYAVDRIEFADGTTRNLADYLNHAPVVANPLPDMKAERGQLFKQSLWNTFFDPDSQDTPSLTVRQANGQPLPEWLVYDARETTLVGYAPMSPSAVYQLRVTATDKGGLQASDDFTLTLDAPNMAPYVKSSGFGAKINENTFVSMLLPTFADVDADDAVSVKVAMADGSALPGWMSVSGGHHVAAKPGFADAGTYVITSTATDKAGLSVSSNIELVVANVNRAPVPTQALAPIEAAQGTPFSFVLPAKTFVDPDGDPFANKMGMADGSAWPAWLVFDKATKTLSGTPPAGTAPVLTLMLNATDNSGLANDIIFKLNVATDAPLSLSGKGDDDVLNGLSAGDSLLGLAGNDQLNGFGGNDTLDGGTGVDRLNGGAGNDRYLVDATADVVTELVNGGRDTVVATASYTLSPNVEALTLGGNLAIAAYGNSGDNILSGNGNNNFMAGNGGNDILQGGAGNDSLVDNGGKNLFDGGAGNDTFTGAAGNELFIGGTGNDIINTGSGIDLIAFNRGDGSDTLNPSSGLDNVISLGRGIAYADLSLRKVGADLILGTGAGDQINLKNWYAAAANHSVATLQVFIEGGSDYHPALGATIHSQKMQQFNFDALAGKFDQALLADPALTVWKLASGLGLAMTGSSDTTAAGADLAQQYATEGTLANLAQVPALAILGSSSFGDVKQALAGAPIALADGSAFLM